MVSEQFREDWANARRGRVIVATTGRHFIVVRNLGLKPSGHKLDLEVVTTLGRTYTINRALVEMGGEYMVVDGDIIDEELTHSSVHFLHGVIEAPPQQEVENTYNPVGRRF